MNILDALDKFAKDNNLVLCGILLLVAAFVLSFCYRDRIIKGPGLRFGGGILFFFFGGRRMCMRWLDFSDVSDFLDVLDEWWVPHFCGG